MSEGESLPQQSPWTSNRHVECHQVCFRYFLLKTQNCQCWNRPQLYFSSHSAVQDLGLRIQGKVGFMNVAFLQRGIFLGHILASHGSPWTLLKAFSPLVSPLMQTKASFACVSVTRPRKYGHFCQWKIDGRSMRLWLRLPVCNSLIRHESSCWNVALRAKDYSWNRTHSSLGWNLPRIHWGCWEYTKLPIRNKLSNGSVHFIWMSSWRMEVSLSPPSFMLDMQQHQLKVCSVIVQNPKGSCRNVSLRFTALSQMI